MAWTIEFAPGALNDLKKLDRTVARRITAVIEDRIATLDDPRAPGQPLAGEWSGYWRYRIGDYRIVARIEDRILTISIVKIGHRREIYRD